MRLRLQVDVKREFVIDYPTKNAPDDFKKFMDSFLKWQCGLIIERTKEVVRKKLYNWHPLSPSYVKFKEKMGLDPRTWLASGQVEKAIHYWYSPLADSYFIGVHPTLRHRNYIKGGYDQKKKGTRIIDIIRYLEFGTTKMKPRPLFTKVLAEFKSKKRQTELYAQFIQLSKTGVL
jgi:hypothetical protein